jgi:CheY-like chemotaxis protein
MPRILVVAPEESRRRLVQILRNAGHLVAAADCEESAIKSTRSILPGLVLMAIVMDQGNGLEIAAKLRRMPDFSAVPIILLGSVTPIGMNDEPLVSLVNGYLDIDVSAEDLLVTVEAQLAKDKGS